FAHPSRDAPGITDYKRIIGHIFSDHRSRSDESVFPDRIAADYSCISANARAALNKGLLIFIPAYHCASRVYHIREDHRWTAENILFEDHTSIDRDVVLDLHI